MGVVAGKSERRMSRTAGPFRLWEGDTERDRPFDAGLPRSTPTALPHTLTPMSRTLRLLALLALAVSVAACDSSGPEPEPEPPVETAPTFQIASVVVPFGDGTQGLQFAATPNADIRIVRVDVRNPLGNTTVFSPQESIILSGQSVALQASNEAYVRVSGNWSFRFVGTRAAGSLASFDVTTPLSVSARVRND